MWFSMEQYGGDQFAKVTMAADNCRVAFDKFRPLCPARHTWVIECIEPTSDYTERGVLGPRDLEPAKSAPV
jgi:hypothetical protein